MGCCYIWRRYGSSDHRGSKYTTSRSSPLTMLDLAKFKFYTGVLVLLFRSLIDVELMTVGSQKTIQEPENEWT